MASKIKVDQLETADGSGTITLQNQLSGMTTASLPALGAAQMPTGSVLQVVHTENGTKQTLNDTTAKLIETSITMKGANSSLLIRVNVPIGGDDNGNSDIDIALAFGYKSGSASSSSTDYSKAGGRSAYARSPVTGLDSWFNSDTKQHGEGYDNHWVLHTGHEYLKTGLTYAAGTTVQVALWCRTNGGAYDFCCAENKADTDAGMVMSLNITEIAG